MPAPAPAVERNKVALLTKDQLSIPEAQQVFGRAFHFHCCSNTDEFLALDGDHSFAACIIDIDTADLSPQAGLERLQQLRQRSMDLVIVALTRSGNRHVRLKVQEYHADEFFVVPLDFQELRSTLERALEKRSVEIENRLLKKQISARYSYGELVGGSEAMRSVYDAIERVAQSSTTILLRGESGTGKELVAREIIKAGPRRDKPYICLNCAALPENLIEAELFGHEKGAFTGAHAARAGHIEEAHTGTLFLDEIATLPLSLQTKLLRVLEERSVQRLGSKLSKKIDFRLITATNEDLEEMVRAGRFREDLYYRVNVIPIQLPALRERAGDIPLLADHFMRIYSIANGVESKRFDKETLEILEENPWRGNIRELENLIQRLVLMVQGPVIKPEHLPSQILYSSTSRQQQLLIPEGGIDFDDEMRKIECAYLQAALQRTGWKKTAAAMLLGIPVQRVKYLCRKYNLSSN
jgi:DNA-binding NtrC family response regulator